MDVLVNNAGKATGMTAIGGGKVDDWWSVQVRCFLIMRSEYQLMKFITIANQPLQHLRNDRRICRFTLGIWERRAWNTYQCLVHEYAVSKFGVAKITQFVHAGTSLRSHSR